MFKRSTDKIKENARKLFDARKYDKALPVYEELCKLEPQNPRWPHKLGEIQQRIGKKTQAVSSYQRAVRHYAKQGFLVKAIALCKVILELAPDDTEAQNLLAELCVNRPYDRIKETPRPTTPATPKPLERKTIPPGAPLEAVQLSRVVPSAIPKTTGPNPELFEIPLDEGDLDSAFSSIQAASESTDDMLHQVAPTPLFLSLPYEALSSLIRRVLIRDYEPNVWILRQGELGESLYVIVEGTVSVCMEHPMEQELTTLSDGAFFGEMALLTSAERTASVKTVTPCTLMEISREAMADLVEEYPQVLKVLLRFFRERLIDKLVRTHELFIPYADTDRDILAKRFALIEMAPRCDLIQEGKPADGLYLLLAGHMTFHRRENAEEWNLRSGQLIGEDSLLTGEPSLGTVTAESKCWLLKMDPHVFREVIMTHPHVLSVISSLSLRRKEERDRAEEEGRFSKLHIQIGSY